MLNNFDELFKLHAGLNLLDLLNSKKVIIFGAGQGGIRLKKFLSDKSILVHYFCDNSADKQKKYIDGVKVLSPEFMAELNANEYIVCIASNCAREIAYQLRKLGIVGYIDLTYYGKYWEGLYDRGILLNGLKDLRFVYNTLSDLTSRKAYLSCIRFRLTLDPLELDISRYKQYYHPLVKPENGDTIINGGAYDGKTSIEMHSALAGDCLIYAFEPEDSNYKLLTANIGQKGINTIIPVKTGLWKQNESGFMDVNSIKGTTYRVEAINGTPIELQKIDTFIKRNDIEPSLIKMDIEGSELEALEGAIDAIYKFKPKLIISIYHRPEDLWTIPRYVSSLNLGYQFYFGHHSQNVTESILYCKV